LGRVETEKIRVLCVDDSDDIAQMLERSVAAEPDMTSVGRLPGADDLVSEVARARPSVVLLDLTMPGKDPLSAVRELHAAHPTVRVIVYSGYDDRAAVNSAMDAGAWGFVPKHTDVSALLGVIRNVAQGAFVFPE
jgi:two-component system response regulator DesR